MRPQIDLRAHSAKLALGALGIGSSIAVAGPLAAHAAIGSSPAVSIALKKRELRNGEAAVVVGAVANGTPGDEVVLQFAPYAGAWQTVATATTGARGSYRLAARLNRTGLLRVSTGAAGVRAATVASQPTASSPTTPAFVAANVRARTADANVLAGRQVTVHGALGPVAPGRKVSLQIRSGARWLTVARARVGASGRFALRFTPAHTGSLPARITFRGDHVNAATRKRLGTVNVYRLAGASWYGPGGSTACGQSLTAGMLGVANKTLPCGTLVTLRYGSRTVRVPVIDRGPYVAGRDYDLTVATKRALGFPDTGDVWATR